MKIYNKLIFQNEIKIMELIEKWFLEVPEINIKVLRVYIKDRYKNNPYKITFEYEFSDLTPFVERLNLNPRMIKYIKNNLYEELFERQNEND